MAYRINLNGISFHGKGAIAEIPALLKEGGHKKAFVATAPGFSDVRSLEGLSPTKNPAVFTIAVPTTSGTAAEVTINYVITDRAKNRKFVCVDPHDIPHGVACAILLPPVMKFNAPATGKRYADIARAMGVKGADAMPLAKARKAACDAVAALGADVGIPPDLKGIVQAKDIPFLARSAYADACRPGNPRDVTEAEIAKLYKSLI